MNAAYAAQAALISAQTAQLQSANQDLNTFWQLWGGTCVFLFQMGFALLEVGSVQGKNQKNILIKVTELCRVESRAHWNGSRLNVYPSATLTVCAECF